MKKQTQQLHKTSTNDSEVDVISKY
jgi:hypothetical protein